MRFQFLLLSCDRGFPLLNELDLRIGEPLLNFAVAQEGNHRIALEAL